MSLTSEERAYFERQWEKTSTHDGRVLLGLDDDDEVPTDVVRRLMVGNLAGVPFLTPDMPEDTPFFARHLTPEFRAFLEEKRQESHP